MSGIMWRFTVCTLAGWALGVGLAQLLVTLWPSWASGNIPLGLACGYGGVLLGFVAGGLWANHYDTKRERRP
jgi:hypothetical protein